MDLNKKKSCFPKTRLLGVMVIIFVVSVITRIYYFALLRGIRMFPDSSEYLQAANKLAQFKIDSSRVPLYPLFIQAAQKVFQGGRPEVPVIIMQVLVSSLSMALVFYISYYLFGSWIKSGVVSLFAITNIWVINWDFYILTESLTVSVVVMLLLCLVLYLNRKSLRYLILIYLLSGCLIFVRPFYLLLPAAIFIVLSIKGLSKRNYRQVLTIGVISLSFIYSAVFGYSWVNLKQNGYFGVSDVSVVNRLGKILQYRMYDLSDNEKLKRYIQEETRLKQGEIPEPVEFINKYSLNTDNYSEISKFSSDIIRKYPLRYIGETLKLTADEIFNQWEAFADYNTDNYKYERSALFFDYICKIPVINTFKGVFILILAECLFLVSTRLLKQRIEPIWIFIQLLVVYQVAMSIAGAHAEYSRLIAPTYILLLILIFKYAFLIFDGVKWVCMKVKLK